MSGLRTLGGPVWRWPVLLALFSGVGLVSALVADGFWDAVSWLALGLPVVISAWYGLRRKPRG